MRTKESDHMLENMYANDVGPTSSTAQGRQHTQTHKKIGEIYFYYFCKKKPFKKNS